MVPQWLPVVAAVHVQQPNFLFGKTGGRRFDGGKSGHRRRGYQRKAGGRKATESATENIPLQPGCREGEMPASRAGPDQGNLDRWQTLSDAKPI